MVCSDETIDLTLEVLNTFPMPTPTRISASTWQLATNVIGQDVPGITTDETASLYTVVYTEQTHGCGDTADVALTFNPLPELTIIAGWPRQLLRGRVCDRQY